ncbi:hypothetical protein IFO70_06800 [Phormidium tenue FACHB-886]|nr:hypothetical protein [Phormidium tenue FACHB-886]
MDTERDPIKFKFPLWKYLTQPVFSPEFKSLNPLRFWQIYNQEQLEACWQKSAAPEPQWIDDPVQFLEDCFMSTSLGIQLIQDPNVVQFLERCWDRQPPPYRNYKTDQSFGESEECY